MRTGVKWEKTSESRHVKRCLYVFVRGGVNIAKSHIAHSNILIMIPILNQYQLVLYNLKGRAVGKLENSSVGLIVFNCEKNETGRSPHSRWQRFTRYSYFKYMKHTNRLRRLSGSLLSAYSPKKVLHIDYQIILKENNHKWGHNNEAYPSKGTITKKSWETNNDKTTT